MPCGFGFLLGCIYRCTCFSKVVLIVARSFYYHWLCRSGEIVYISHGPYRTWAVCDSQFTTVSVSLEPTSCTRILFGIVFQPPRVIYCCSVLTPYSVLCFQFVCRGIKYLAKRLLVPCLLGTRLLRVTAVAFERPTSSCNAFRVETFRFAESCALHHLLYHDQGPWRQPSYHLASRHLRVFRWPRRTVSGP